MTSYFFGQYAGEPASISIASEPFWALLLWFWALLLCAASCAPTQRDILDASDTRARHPMSRPRAPARRRWQAGAECRRHRLDARSSAGALAPSRRVPIPFDCRLPAAMRLVVVSMRSPTSVSLAPSNTQHAMKLSFFLKDLSPAKLAHTACARGASGLLTAALLTL